MKTSRVVVGLLVALSGSGASAACGVSSEWAANAVMTVVSQASCVNNAWTPSPGSNGTTVIGRNFTVPAPGNRLAAAEARIAISNAMASSIGARAFARMLPYVGTGILGYEILAGLGYLGDGNGGLLRSTSTAPTSGPGWCLLQAGCSAGVFATEEQACAVTLQSGLGGADYAVYLGTQQEGPNRRCYRHRYDNGQSSPRVANDGYLDITPGPVVTICPGGGSPNGNGQCPGANVPADYVEAGGHIVESNAMSPQDYADMVADAMGQLGPEFQVNFGDHLGSGVGPMATNVLPEWLEIPGETGNVTTPGGSSVHFETTWRWTPQTTSSPTPSIRRTTDRWDGTRTTTTTLPNGQTTVTTEPAPSDGGAPQGESITCGLPNTPACKLDETGTPTVATFETPTTNLNTRTDEGIRIITDQGSVPRVLPWLWGGISLPGGACANMTVASPADGIPDGTIDICGQPWVAWWRLASAWLAGIWTVAYCWRRFNDVIYPG